MNHPAESPVPPPAGVRQPCTEACAAFRPIASDRWSEFGLCLNPHSPRRGYPVRLGQECNDYQVAGRLDTNRAS